jgi:hypothetical protein
MDVAAERLCPQCAQPTQALTCPVHHCPTVLRAAGSLDMLHEGTVIGGRYRTGKLLGKGGFGAVFLAQHVATGQELVVKVLKPDLGEDTTHVQRFFNEARASSQLSHPHTVRVFDFGQTDAGLLYMAMERLHGVELAQAIKETAGHRLDVARTLRMGIAVCKSLSEAHHAGLVHRDLKPDNIFLCRVHGEQEFVKVIDFGIAKPTSETDTGLTRTGFTVGTPKYMSPEQITNKPLDGRSDLYALGVILYQCLAGRVPFTAGSPMETLVMQLQADAEPLHQVAPGTPRELSDLVMRCLRKSPWERFVDADELREALEALLIEVEPVAPRTPTGRTAAVRAPTPGAMAAAAPPHAEAMTAVLEHPTSRDTYQPSTLSLPTARVGGTPQDRGEGAPAPAAVAKKTRVVTLAAVALAVVAVGGASLWLVRSPSPPDRGQDAPPVTSPALQPPPLGAAAMPSPAAAAPSARGAGTIASGVARPIATVAPAAAPPVALAASASATAPSAAAGSAAPPQDDGPATRGRGESAPPAAAILHPAPAGAKAAASGAGAAGAARSAPRERPARHDGKPAGAAAPRANGDEAL